MPDRRPPQRRELARLLRDAALRYPSLADAARAFGLSPSALSRALRDGREPLSVRRLLHIAFVAELEPLQLLRAASRAGVADLLTQLFGQATLPEAVRELAETILSLPPDDRRFLREMVGLLQRRRAEARARVDCLIPPDAGVTG
jgi:transcriptional regulator with XRE-family HTH domain